MLAMPVLAATVAAPETRKKVRLFVVIDFLPERPPSVDRDCRNPRTAFRREQAEFAGRQ